MMADLVAIGCSISGLYGRFLWVNTNGSGTSSREGFLIMRGVLVNPSGNLSSRALRSSNFLTSISANEVRKSGFKVRV